MGDPVIHAILSKCSAIVRNFNYGGISAKYYWDINKPWLGCNGTFKHNQSAKNEPLYITQIIYISCNLPIYQYYCCVFIGMYVCMYAVACTGLRRGRGEMLLQGKWAGCWSPSARASRFTILSRFFVMLGFLFCKLFEHYSQTHFHIIKTKPFKVTQYF